MRPRLDPDVWRPEGLTATFALGWTLTLGVLGTITAIWLVGMVATTAFFLLGQGGLASVLAFAGTGVLLGRGWVGMVQTIRGRLRRRDLDDAAALPASFHSLTPGLQRLVRHTRSLQIVARDPETSLASLDRDLFDWLATIAGLAPDDRRFLEDRGMATDQLREEIVCSRWLEDRHRRLGRRPAQPGRARHSTHRQRALAVLERFEHAALRAPGDPFRGGASHLRLVPTR